MKKLLSIILTLCMILTAFAGFAASAETVGADESLAGYKPVTADAAKESLTDLSTLNAAPTSGEYKISDAAGIQKLAAFVSGGATLAGVTVYLTSDVDLSAVTGFTGIGDASHAFEGTFNGQGYTVTVAITVEESATAPGNSGLFVLISGNAVIKNVQTAGSLTVNKNYNTYGPGHGVVVGTAKGNATVENVYNKASMKAMSWSVAGVVGLVTGGGTVTVKNCQNDGDIYTETDYMLGGVVGLVDTASAVVENCLNNGDLIAKETATAEYLGGVVGFARTTGAAINLTVTNCINTGDFSALRFIAGVVGTTTVPTTISACTNTGAITAGKRDAAYVKANGGIVGQMATGSVTNCRNDGVINAENGSLTAGICGNATGVIAFTNCVNNGAVTVTNNGAGIVANCPAGCTMDGCTNTARISGFATVHGLCPLPNNCAITNSESTGSVGKPINPGEAGDDTSVVIEGKVGYDAAAVVKKNLDDIPNLVDFYELPETQTEFKITTPEGLQEFSNAMYFSESFEGITIYLANDINMDGYDYLTAGGGSTMFMGTFDGQGFMIENLKIDESASDASYASAGLIGKLGGTVKNLIIGENCEFIYRGNKQSFVGSIAGGIDASATIENCYSKATVEGNYAVGGIAGQVQARGANASIIHCTNEGSVVNNLSGHTAGGILGMITAANVSVKYCRNIGTVEGLGGSETIGALGGMVGRSWGDNTVIENCINNGEVTAEQAPSAAGSMLGCMQVNDFTATIKNCINYGFLTAAKIGIYASTENKPIVTMTKCAERANQEDPTLADAKLTGYVPDYTPNEGNTGGGVTPPVTDAPVTDAPVTNAPVTDAPTTNAPTTNAPATNAPTTEPAKKGCGAAIGGMMIVLVAAGAALVVSKKKED